MELIRDFSADLRREFEGYSFKLLSKDLLAGLTVAAVALPLALAFGVGSGADAAAGMITAIASAFLIGSLSGASFQISGPTGAMTAILVPLAMKFGLASVFAAGVIAGAILIVAGLFKVGKLISFIPASVIAGFTSGIALVIGLGQVGNLLGIHAEGEQVLSSLYHIITSGQSVNFSALIIGLSVAAFMLLWPKKWGARVPASLLALIAAMIVQSIFKFDVAIVGSIPRTLIHESRLTLSSLFQSNFSAILSPAISIAALCMIESLLCGAVAGKMKGETLNGNRELIAQGIGNIVLPFLGGVPATAAIARTSVAIKSGCQTRVAGIFHGVVLMLSMFFLSPWMSVIPLSALAGVLIVTAWRMNEWDEIKHIFSGRMWSPKLKFLVTMAATVVLDLTTAIAIGCALAILIFIVNSSNVEVTVDDVDNAIEDEKWHEAVRQAAHKRAQQQMPAASTASARHADALASIAHLESGAPPPSDEPLSDVLESNEDFNSDEHVGPDGRRKMPIARHTQAVYIHGALFFGTKAQFEEELKKAKGDVLILFMRGVPSMDAAGLQSLASFCYERQKSGGKILLCGVQSKVREMLDKAGVTERLGEGAYFSSASDAFTAAADVA